MTEAEVSGTLVGARGAARLARAATHALRVVSCSWSQIFAIKFFCVRMKHSRQELDPYKPRIVLHAAAVVVGRALCARECQAEQEPAVATNQHGAC